MSKNRYKMNEHDLPFEFYKSCDACHGHGSVYLNMTDIEELKKWAKRLDQDEAFYGYNFCNVCQASGLVLDFKLKELELEE